MSRYELLHGDCLEKLKGLPDNSVDAVVCDPPYGLEFMGREWDAPWKHTVSETGYTDGGDRLPRPSFTSSRNPICTGCGKRQRTWKSGPEACKCANPKWDRRQADEMRGFQDWCELWATECLRVLKPGGHLLAFGGDRTHHRLTCAIEDAGFEIRSAMVWLFGQGFPKNTSISRQLEKKEETRHAAAQWEGWGSHLKPAAEFITVARRPLTGTIAANVLEWGTGGINVDACRVGVDKHSYHSRGIASGRMRECNLVDRGDGKTPDGRDLAKALAYVEQSKHRAPQEVTGRFPPNALFSHLPECRQVGTKVEEPVEAWDCVDGCAVRQLDEQSGTLKSGRLGVGHGSGNNFGVGNQDKRPRKIEREYGNDSGGASRFFPAFRYQAKAPPKERKVEGVEGQHPTQKPEALCRWLVRLVTPPNGVVLDPFTGSGTTGVAALLEGFRFIGCEREDEYYAIAKARLDNAVAASTEKPEKPGKQGTLFDMEET